MNFSDWMNEVRISKPKKQVIIHSDMDGWLKSVDGLSRELKNLKSIKDKIKQKMSKIGLKPQKTEVPEKPEEKEKSEEKDKKTKNQIDSNEKKYSNKEIPQDELD